MIIGQHPWMIWGPKTGPTVCMAMQPWLKGYNGEKSTLGACHIYFSSSPVSGLTSELKEAMGH